MGEHDHRMRKRGKIVLIGFLLVASFFLLTEHTAHFLGVLPYLILLACPLMHLFSNRCPDPTYSGWFLRGRSARDVEELEQWLTKLMRCQTLV
ncbi:DUF2933 domain-containing protein [Novosphingobium resinovorum]|uniref:DUF2933 domain-containing protein n=1 Tax=Novosphingobium resinovorum TaxID=158500 RepID=A0A1D8AGA2_9SPHN|nr:DUF2933 domain-containing protein [Novosphingobium resinovorum]AOR81129.1 hypothetical protein BES08_30080 [Novosphingobium resinovorum]